MADAVTATKKRYMNFKEIAAYSPGGILNAFAWPLAVYRKQRVFIVYRVDYQGI